MVDDYSFPDPSFSYKEFDEHLSSKGFTPDIVFRESQLIPVCDQVIESIQDKHMKEELISYVQQKRYPCSLFIAAWYLLRLGHLSYPLFNKELCAKRLLN